MTTPFTATPAPKADASIATIWNHCWDIVTNHYADATGTATRREFFTFYLSKLVVCFVLLIVLAPLGVIAGLGLLIPTFALGARRLHETGKSGWWQALGLIPILGFVVVLILLAQPAEDTS